MHRWLGVLGCLLFLDWFVSGIAMIYVQVPAVHNGAHDTRHANGFPCH